MRASPPTLLRLDDGSWSVVLLFAAGIGYVIGGALFFIGAVEGAVACLVQPVVSTYTAYVLHLLHSPSSASLRRRAVQRALAIVLNLILLVPAAVVLVMSFRPLFSGDPHALHPFTLAALVMSVLIQVAVILGGYESLARLARFARPGRASAVATEMSESRPGRH